MGMVSEVRLEGTCTFTVRINGGDWQEFTTRTGNAAQAAAAAIAMLPYEEKDGPIIVEVDDQMGEIFKYRIGFSQSGSLVVETHNLRKDRALMTIARMQGIEDAVPSVLVEYRPPEAK